MGGFIGDIFQAVGLVEKPPKPAKAPDPVETQQDLNKEEALARDRARRARAMRTSGYASTLAAAGNDTAGMAGGLLGNPNA
jgi:hypothetical protein